ncbi:hypothetical protein QDQ39_21210 [Providencia rettgeri]|uniref:hypothetical protein n=1 Tax=Providencia rettgeri TaxID=587 RepID=UPI002449565E|nr:hypothetical protein [Providencia rettgeri]MDH2398329.1 hypothetical protein [Providencia rettgeri]
MAVILIESPISVVTSAGHNVIITGINPTSTDCIAGKFIGENGVEHKIMWDLSGIARDHKSEWNINLKTDDTLMDLRETAISCLSDDVKRFL